MTIDSSHGKSDPPDQRGEQNDAIFVGDLDAYRTPNSDDYQRVLTSGLIVLDTNVLLNLYRYHTKTRSDLIQILNHLKGRVWVPYHVMHEFFERRLDVIDEHAEEIREAISSITRHSSDLEQTIRTWANRISLSAHQVDELIKYIEDPMPLN